MGLFEEKKRANQSNIDRHTKAVELAIGRRRSRGPILPPNPFYTRLVCTRKVWPPVTSARLKVKTNYDVDKLKTLTETIPFDRLGKLKRGYLFEYFLGLVKWVQLIRDEDEEHRGYMRDFPSDLTYTLAKQIGRLAAASSDGDAWKTLTDLNRMLSKGELIGIYLDAVVHDLMASGRPPDDRFWRAWRPAADWVMSTLVPKRGQVRSQELENAVLTAGFVGPYITSIPPDWPHLELLLPRINSWVSATNHSASSAYAVLSICERMSLCQLEKWFVRWLLSYVDEHKSDPNFWQYAGFSDRAAGLLIPLENQSVYLRNRVRRILSVMANSGSLVAREVLPRFSSTKPE